VTPFWRAMQLKNIRTRHYDYEFTLTHGSERVVLSIYRYSYTYHFCVRYSGEDVLVDDDVVMKFIRKLMSKDEWFKVMFRLMSMLHPYTQYMYSTRIFSEDRAAFEERLLNSIWISATRWKKYDMVREALRLIKENRGCFRTKKLDSYVRKFSDGEDYIRALSIACSIKCDVKR